MKSIFLLTTFLFILLSTTVRSQILTSAEPDTGVQCQKLTITVTGENTNFYQGTSLMWLEREGSEINPVSNTVVSPTVIEGVFFFNPSHNSGTYDVHAYNGAGSGDMVLTDGFFLQEVNNQPELVSSDPDTAYYAEMFLLSISGTYTHFDEDDVNNTIWLTSENGGYVTASSINVNSSLQVDANFVFNYNKPAGNYSLHLKNRLDGELLLADAITLIENENSPEIVSVEPDSAYQGEALTLTITGRNTNFQQGSSMLNLSKTGLGYISPVSHNVVNDTIMTGYFNFSFDQNPGDYDVTVMNWELGDVTLIDGFHLLPSADLPKLLSVSPEDAFQGTRVTLIIKGENTQFDAEGNTALVTLKQDGEELYCTDAHVVDALTLEAEYVFSYVNWTGQRELIVETPLDGKMTLENSFDILEAEANPSIVSVVPDSADRGDTLTISVSATGTIFMQGTTSLYLSQDDFVINATNGTIVNDTLITGDFNFLNTDPLGKYNINIKNYSGWPSFSLPDGFTLQLFNFMGEKESHALLTVYPNPATDVLFIKRNFKSGGTFYLKVFDISGRLLLEDIIDNNISEKQLDISSFPKGTYLLKIVEDQNEQVERFVIR